MAQKFSETISTSVAQVDIYGKGLSELEIFQHEDGTFTATTNGKVTQENLPPVAMVRYLAMIVHNLSHVISVDREQ